ncbi:MAG: hypothetical protein DBY38_02395 [Clostridium cadaveris]|uniref:Uncharacterized protein n=1 Tax=Clostridium cadaveris TaxID=1529 RepID=A0A316MRX2_9CLOT|nr:MAG: hypothetical protein DBY38_02395 [Clostridium cadaveris]
MDGFIFDKTVTVVNKYVDHTTKEVSFNKTILNNCMWKKKIEKTTENSNIKILYYFSVTILSQAGYLPPNKYRLIPNNEIKNYWTLNPNNEDLIILGEYKDDIDESLYHDLLNNYDDIGVIQSVVDNTKVPYLKHWKVVCK